MTTITIPNIGTDDAVEIIEILVKKGDNLDKEQPLLVLESDKASMEIPSPHTGRITEIKVSVGDKVKEGDAIGEMEAAEAAEAPATPPAPTTPPPPEKEAVVEPAKQKVAEPEKDTAALANKTPAAQVADAKDSEGIYAGPAVRKLSRELGIDLRAISGSGDKGRIAKEDLHEYIKARMNGAGGGALPPEPTVDFAAFGEIEIIPMDKIHKLTAVAMQTSVLNAPHVTQFDEADVTDLEHFRKMQKELAASKGLKLTPVPFLLKALASALSEFPQFNASVKGDNIVRKHYCHIGLAVDTPMGLVVPVIRDVNHKNIWQLAEEVMHISDNARNRKLKPQDMQGGCITLSSLGAGGGTQFTPIINLPEVAILGVSRVIKKPVYQDDQALPVPRLMMPLALSYDHRAVNGVDGAKFTRHISALLTDIRKIAM